MQKPTGPGLLLRGRQWAKAIKRDAVTISIAARDPRVPWYAKVLAGAVAAYALSPIDLIPDFVWGWGNACVLHDLRDRRPSHPVAQIPKRSLSAYSPTQGSPTPSGRARESRVARPVGRAAFPAAPRLRDQFAMPAEDRVRCHQRRDVAKGAPADLVAEHSQSPTLIIGQSNAMAEQLRLQGPVLFAKKIDDRTLLTLDPSKERHEQEVERKHAPESIRNSIHLPHAAGTNLGNNFIRAEARPGSQQHDDRLG